MIVSSGYHVEFGALEESPCFMMGLGGSLLKELGSNGKYMTPTWYLVGRAPSLT